ncbi:MAG: hypothetical protein P8Y36_01125, partial [Alphaproteobacteria bacterium]
MPTDLVGILPIFPTVGVNIMEALHPPCKQIVSFPCSAEFPKDLTCRTGGYNLSTAKPLWLKAFQRKRDAEV